MTIKMSWQKPRLANESSAKNFLRGTTTTAKGIRSADYS